MEKLKEFIKSIPPGERAAFAARCGTTIGHLTNVAYGYRSCSEALAIALERESGRELRCEMLRPDIDWAFIRGTDAA